MNRSYALAWNMISNSKDGDYVKKLDSTEKGRFKGEEGSLNQPHILICPEWNPLVGVLFGVGLLPIYRTLGSYCGVILLTVCFL